MLIRFLETEKERLMSKYIIVVDTICEGIQALERDEKDNIIVYATEEEAEAEIMDTFEELTKNQKESGQEVDEYPTEFVLHLEDYVEGHKTIWTGEQT
jgi:hypothetical protein